MSSIPLIPPGLDIYESKAPQCYAAAIATYLFAVIAVALRFWARRLMKAEIWVDDWTAAAALVLATGSFIGTIVWLHHGFGHHFEVLGMDFASTFGKNFWTGELLYCLTIGLVKFSILAFYWRLFRVSIRIAVYVLGAVTICWEIGVILATVFQCVPVSGFWNKTILARCVNPKHAFLGNSIPNIATDIALLLMPVPYIWRLHRTSSQKIVLTGIFMLGGFVTVISIVRLTILLKIDLNSPDLDYNFVGFVSWSIAESNMAIVAACLPSLRPILSLILYGDPNPSVRNSKENKGFSNSTSRSWTQRSEPSAIAQNHGQPTTRSASDSQHNLVPLQLPDEAFGFSGLKHAHGTAVAGLGERKMLEDDDDIEMQTGGLRAECGIQVRSDVTVLSTRNR